MKKYFFILTLLTITFAINAQIIPDTLWTKTFGGLSTDIGVSMQQTFDNDFILAGNTFSFGSGCTDVWLIKTDEFGIEEWNQTYGGVGNDYAHSIQQTSDFGYIIAGTTSSYGAGGADGWLLKTDEFGNEEWNQTFGQEEYDGAFSVQQTIDGGYVITGYSFVPIEDQTDSWLIKTDENGIEEWSRIFDTGSNEESRSVQQTIDGGFIIAGSTNNFSYFEGDILILKTDVNGNEVWRKIYGDTGVDRAHSIQQISENDFVVLGFTQSTGSADFWLLRLGLVTNINNNSISYDNILINNFPNPFNPSTSIEFSINNNSHIELSIYNIKGQKIKTLAQNEFTKGSHSIIWNGDNESEDPVSSGLYLYKLKIDGKTEVIKKCLLLK